MNFTGIIGARATGIRFIRPNVQCTTRIAFSVTPLRRGGKYKNRFLRILMAIWFHKQLLLFLLFVFIRQFIIKKNICDTLQSSVPSFPLTEKRNNKNNNILNALKLTLSSMVLHAEAFYTYNLHLHVAGGIKYIILCFLKEQDCLLKHMPPLPNLSSVCIVVEKGFISFSCPCPSHARYHS